METNYISNLAIHPGELLEETLEDLGMSQAELADRMGRPKQMINEIIKGKKRITPTTALELENVLGIPSHIWLGLENEYQMVRAKQKEQEQMEKEASMVSRFPYAELAKHGFVKATRKAVERVEELKRFFGVAKLEQIAKVKTYQPAFRVSDHTSVSHEAIAAWLQAARVKAASIETAPFDKKRLESCLPNIKSLMLKSDINEALNEVKHLLAECGVALVLLPHFKKTKVNGATFWMDDRQKAIVALSLKGRYADIFWFSLFHELAHLLLHDKREVFLEDGYDDPSLLKQEKEADAFARDLLIPPELYEKFVMSGSFTKESIVRFAKACNVLPAIVVGRLMHEGLVKYNNSYLNGLRPKYQWTE